MSKTKLAATVAAAALVAGAIPAAQAAAKFTLAPAAGAKARVFLPIVKIDAKTRTVECRITDETVDTANEICDYESSAPYFAKWSENASKLTGGKSKGNLRAMHQPKAAGKLIDLVMDDETKAIDCVAKVVDDAEWEKVEEGVYTGMSLGGNYVGKKWRDTETGAWRYTVDPVEVSLVDLPCNPSATFKAVGMDGVETEKAFKPWEPANREIQTKADALFKAAAPEGGSPFDFINEARAALIVERAETFTMQDMADAEVEDLTGDDDDEPIAESDDSMAPTAADAQAGEGGGDAPTPATPEPKEAVSTPAETDWGSEQVWRVNADGSIHASKKEATLHVEQLKAVQAVGGDDLLAQAIAKAKAAVSGERPAESADSTETLATVVKTEGLADLGAALKALCEDGGEGGVVLKSMYSVGRFAELIQSIVYLQQDACWEADYEGDNSAVPAAMAEGIRTLGEAFRAMAEEEVAELLSTLRAVGAEAKIVNLAAKPGMEKVAEVLAAVEANEAVCEKVGARNSKTDKAMIQTIHDHACKLGGACDAEKAAPAEVVKLTEALEVEKTRVEKAVGAIEEFTAEVTKMRGELDTTKAELAKLKAEPAPMPQILPGAEVVTRGAGGANLASLTPEQAAIAVKTIVEQMGQEGLARLAMKAVQATPIQVQSSGA